MGSEEERRPGRASTASQSTFLSLQQLDPSPIASPDLEKQLPNLPSSESSPARSSILGLSGSNHGTIYYLTRIQRYTSYTFLIFSTIHITNTSLIPLLTQSVAKSEPYLLLTRPLYQSSAPPLEHVLITLPVILHILSGLAQRLHRRNLALARTGVSTLPFPERLKWHLKIWPKLSWTSKAGYALIPLLAGHVWFNRLAPWVYEGGSSSIGLSYVSHGFAKWPLWSWMGYGALVVVGTGHGVWGMYRWLGGAGNGTEGDKKRRRWILSGVWALLAGAWVGGGFGIVGRAGLSEGWIGRGFDALYNKASAW